MIIYAGFIVILSNRVFVLPYVIQSILLKSAGSNTDYWYTFSCLSVSAQPLHDPNYKVVVQAVKLRRQVEMYQWVEYRESKSVCCFKNSCFMQQN